MTGESDRQGDKEGVGDHRKGLQYKGSCILIPSLN
jgi:hypothetical protein